SPREGRGRRWPGRRRAAGASPDRRGDRRRVESCCTSLGSLLHVRSPRRERLEALREIGPRAREALPHRSLAYAPGPGGLLLVDALDRDEEEHLAARRRQIEERALEAREARGALGLRFGAEVDVGLGSEGREETGHVERRPAAVADELVARDGEEPREE